MDPRRRLLHVPSAGWTDRQVRIALRGQEREDAVPTLEHAASEALGAEVVAFGSGRAALAAVLIALSCQQRRVFIPAYTCVAVPNAVRTVGAEASWVDVAGPNLDIVAVRHRATSGDAVLAQHTYGVPCDAEALRALRNQGLTVIEDRAHRFDGRDLVGDGAIWSMEHSKVISSGQGGLAWARDQAGLTTLRRLQAQWAPISDAEARRILRTSASQVLLTRWGDRVEPMASLLRRVALRTSAISYPAQSDDEMTGGDIALSGPHPVLATLGAEALMHLDDILRHRTMIGRIYRTLLAHLVPSWARADLPYVRQPLLVADAESTTQTLRSAGMDLGRRWFDNPIHPRGSVSTYRPGAAPEAESLSSHVLSLPTHTRINEQTATRIAQRILTAVS